MRNANPRIALLSSARLASLLVVAGGLAGCAADTQRFGAPWSTAQQQYNQVYGQPAPAPAPMQAQPQPGDVTGSIPQRPAPTVTQQALPPIRSTQPQTALAQPQQSNWMPSNQPQAPFTPAPATSPSWTPPASQAPWTPPPAPPPRVTTTAQPIGAVAPRPQPAVAPANGPFAPGATVVVGEGDTFNKIAHRYHVETRTLLAANNIQNADQIRVGQRLVVPGLTASAVAERVPPHVPERPTPPRVATAPAQPAFEQPAVAGPQGPSYVVQQGDTLASIARNHNVAPGDLARVNHFGPSDRLQIGQTISLPSTAPRQNLAQIPDTRPTGSVPPATETPVRQPAPRVAPAAPQEEEDQPVRSASANSSNLPAPQQMTSTEFRWPARGRIIAGFGRQPGGGQNDGINIAVPAGTPVKAAENGVVAYAGSELKGYGQLVLIRHDGDWVTAYAHNSEILVKRGDTVHRGQVISRAGQSGSVTQPQLHFEIRRGATPVDPMQHLTGG